jgi:[histone H3]-trimethyl-L-lysine4 demethylase
LLIQGIKGKEHVPFETLADDERQCEICQTTLFLSAVACKCNEKRMTCLRHFRHLCKCDASKKILLYRYQESELASTVKDIKRSLEEYMVWFKNIQEIVFLEKSEKPGETLDLFVKNFYQYTLYRALRVDRIGPRRT